MYMYPTTMSVEMADIILPTAEWLETAYIAQRMHTMLIRRDIVHLYEAVDETMAWSWIALRHGRARPRALQDGDRQLDLHGEGQPLSAYWRTYDEYKDYIAGFAGSAFNRPDLKWDEFVEMAPFDWIGADAWKNTYEDYLTIDEETGKPKGFATESKKCEPYLEQFVKMGRTGEVYGLFRHRGTSTRPRPRTTRRWCTTPSPTSCRLTTRSTRTCSPRVASPCTTTARCSNT